MRKIKKEAILKYLFAFSKYFYMYYNNPHTFLGSIAYK